MGLEPMTIRPTIARVDKEEYITRIVDEKENRGYEHKVEP